MLQIHRESRRDAAESDDTKPRKEIMCVIRRYRTKFPQKSDHRKNMFRLYKIAIEKYANVIALSILRARLDDAKPRRLDSRFTVSFQNRVHK